MHMMHRYGSAPTEPGSAGRWALPTSDGAYDSWAAMMSAVHDMAALWVSYGVVQGFVLVALIIRCVWWLVKAVAEAVAVVINGKCCKLGALSVGIRL